MIANSVSAAVITILLIFQSNVLIAQNDLKQIKGALIEKGEYIVGDMYESKLLKTSGPALQLMQSKIFRLFHLEYNFSIDRGPLDGRSIVMLVNKEKYNEYIEKFAGSNDPNKYHKHAANEYPIYASYQDAVNFCDQRGGRIPKDYEIEIGLKYYRLWHGIKYQEHKTQSVHDIDVYYEFAINEENKPIILKYYAGSIDGIISDFIFIDQRIKIKADEDIAASVRCVYDIRNGGQSPISE